jgi:glucans biosynthesis protein C
MGQILPAGATSRYHALDGLRATMMLLGIYLHVVIAYATIPDGWPYKQPEQTGVLNVTVALIHIFRMPVFYVMAGFFTALLYQRRGFRGAAANRFGRIAVPFVVGWAVIFPLVVLLAGWRAKDHIEPLHLWFLEYLLLLYGLAVLVVPAVEALPAGWRGVLNRFFRAAIQSKAAPALFAVPSFLAVLAMHDTGLDTPTSFIPIPRIIVAYAIPFAFGWLLYHNADLLEALRRRAWSNALWALGLTAWCGAWVEAYYLGWRPAELVWVFLLARASHSLTLWYLIFAITGLFLRYASGPSARWRYLCDSSYFLYLAHMPVILVLQHLVEPVGAPPLVKIPIVLAASIGALLVLYHYAVRPTFIGAALNGRRYKLERGAALPASA